MNDITDEKLFENYCLSDDQQEFSILLRRYAGKAVAVAREYLFDEMAAQDAVQEAFIRISRNRSQYKLGSQFAPWFFRILRNVCLDQLRRRKAYLDAITRFWQDEKDVKNPEVNTSGSEYVQLLSRLPQMERRVLELRINGELSFEEIAAATGCSVEAAKKRAQRGIRKLRDLAKKRLLLPQDENTPCAMAGATF